MIPRRLVAALSCVAIPTLLPAALVAAAPEEPDQRLRTELVWVDPITDVAPDIAFANSVISNILFVNRCVGGCVITPGPNDARANTSSVAQSSVSLSEFTHADQLFDDTIACLREVFSPYDVEVVTEDPGSVPHHEAILAGNSSEMGFASNVGGVAPAACTPLDNVISFSFANTLAPTVTEQCWTVAQESAHAFGLPNHVLDCSDPMTYLRDCGDKYFRDQGLPCGETVAEECRCIGGPVQNSHRTLLAVFGPGEGGIAPAITIERPIDGASVSDEFAVQVVVDDVRVGDLVSMFVNGTHYASRDSWPFEQKGAPYLFSAPAHPDGYMTVEVRARNEIGEVGTTSVRVLKGEPCTSDSQCLDGQSCEDGGCQFAAADRELGQSCADSRECVTGLCPEFGGDKFCSEFCDPADSFSCPVDYQCIPAQDTGICWPTDAVSSSGGCCRVAGSQQSPPLGLVLLLAIAFASVYRRRPGVGSRSRESD